MSIILKLTDDEREIKIKEEYPNFKFERYKIDKDEKDKFFWEWGETWTLYDIPDFALCRDDCLYSPLNPKEFKEWKEKHYVGSSTSTRWRLKKKK